MLYGRCQHRGALMADGFVSGNNLICGVHGWDFRVDTGISEYNNAEKLQSRYQHRLADWEQERQRARAKLAQEIEEERNKKMNELRSQLEQKKQLARIAEARRQSESVRQDRPPPRRH